MSYQPSQYALDRLRDVQSDIDAGVDTLISQIYCYDDKPILDIDAIPGNRNVFDQPKHKERIAASEKAYFLRFWDTVLAHISDNQMPVGYLDLDQTKVSRKKHQITGEEASLLRPAAVPLLTQLQSYFGMTFTNITSRSYEDVTGNLEDPKHILALKPFIRTDMIIASDKPAVDLPAEVTSSDVTFETFEKFRDVLKPPYRYFNAFQSFRTNRGKPLQDIDIVKLMQLAEVQQAGINYLVFDDKEYAGLLKNNTGVSLEFHEQAQY